MRAYYKCPVLPSRLPPDVPALLAEDTAPSASHGSTHLDSGIGLAPLLTGCSWQPPMGRALAAIPKSETPLWRQRTSHPRVAKV